MKRVLFCLAVVHLLICARVSAALDRGSLPHLNVPQRPEARVHLVGVNIKTTLRGHLARTELILTYRNEEHQDLNGELSFPIPPGATVVDAGLYFNGVLRHAVAVERQLGRMAYDQTVRRRIDPALAEWVADDVFRLSVYPIPAKGEKKVFVAYDQYLVRSGRRLQYGLDCRYGARLRWFHLTIDAEEGFQVEPSSLPLTRSGDEWVGSAFEEEVDANFTLSREVPSVPTALIEHAPEDNAFYLSLPVQIEADQRLYSRARHVLLLWDVSGSAHDRDLKTLLEFLKLFFHEQQPEVAVTVVPFHYRLEDGVLIRNVTDPLAFQRLERLLADLVPVGGTHLGLVLSSLPRLLASTPRETRLVLVSDGGNTLTPASSLERAIDSLSVMGKPLLVLNAARPLDPTVLESIARASRGWLINLSRERLSEQVGQAMNRPPQVRVWSSEADFEALTPARPVPGGRRFCVAARLSQPIERGMLSFQLSDRAPEILRFQARSLDPASGLVRSAWARSQLADRLAAKDERGLYELGMKHRLVTPRTSLIVLDTWRDYQRFGIEMPPDVRSEYQRERTEKGVRPPASVGSGPDGSAGPRALQGFVVDSLGLPLPGATVRLRTPDGEVLQEVVSDVSGRFTFHRLPSPGFSVAASLVGFETVVRPCERASPADPPIVISLPVAGVAETVTVTAEAPLVDPRSSGITFSWEPPRDRVSSSPGRSHRNRETPVSTIVAESAASPSDARDPLERRAILEAVVSRLGGTRLSAGERLKLYLAARARLPGDEGFHVKAATALLSHDRVLALRVLTDLLETRFDDARVMMRLAEILEGWHEQDLARLMRDRAVEREPSPLRRPESGLPRWRSNRQRQPSLPRASLRRRSGFGARCLPEGLWCTSR